LNKKQEQHHFDATSAWPGLVLPDLLCSGAWRKAMTVKSILSDKGYDVVTLRPDVTVHDAVATLAKYRIGAIVVTDEQSVIKGIISERDIVRTLAEDGSASLAHPVSALMTANVKVCSENHTINDVMEIMTRGRFRHLPVERDGKLIGVISIGDVVKRRIEEVQQEAEQIRSYIATA
jgi:CBS domain-containing protein